MPEWLAGLIVGASAAVVFGGVIVLCIWTVPWAMGRLFPRDEASASAATGGTDA
jgi:hypothetical protein